MMTISFYTLGKFEVRVQGRRLRRPDWGARSAETVCKILLTYRDQPVDRDWLRIAVWPDLAASASAQRLDWTLAQLSWLLDRDSESNAAVIESGAKAVRLVSDALSIDSRTLLEATWLDPTSEGVVAELERVDDLYCGPYLPEDLGAPWASAERERLEVAYETVLLKLADAYALRGKYHSAILVCQSALIANPTCEPAAGRLMAWAYQLGNSAEGLEVYCELCAWLDSAGRGRPTAALNLMADRLRQGLPLHPVALLQPSALWPQPFRIITP